MRDSIAPEPRVPAEEPCTSTTAEQRDVNPDGFNELDWLLSADAPSADSGGTLREVPEAAGGEAVSITCLAPFSEPREWQFLCCGVDSLDLSLGIEWGPDWDDVSAKLEQAKLRAAGTNGVLSEDLKYVIWPSGKPPSFAWHLEWPEFHLFLGKSPAPKGNNPNGLVAFNSRALWSHGVPGVVQCLVSVLTELGGTVHDFKPSRVDLAADFLLSGDLQYETLRDMRVPCHMKHSVHLNGKELQTFYHGEKSSPIQLRIYNKGEEILQGGTKLWFLQVWNLTSGKHVWRVEYQVRRQALRQLSFATLQDLERKLGGLWEYLTTWFSLRLPGNRNSTRRKVHPWWQGVSACAGKFGPSATLKRNFEGEPADSSWYVSHLAGCLASFAAREGLDDFDDSAALLLARMQNYWRRRKFQDAVAIKSIRLGTPQQSTSFDFVAPSTESRCSHES